MKRVQIFVLATLSALLMSCSEKSSDTSTTQVQQQNYDWKLVTSWPKNFPGLGKGPETFAKHVERMSNGRLKIKVFGAGQMVPGFEVFDTVSSGAAEMGHAGSYYWKGKAPASQIFTAIPFGMNATEMNAWLHYGGGLELWREVYEPFNLIPFAGGNSGIQMAGWFKKEINSVEDLKGLKMRIPGLGGEVLKKLGGLPVALTGGELFTSLQSGAIDATEWVGPYNDLAFGLYKAAKYYYYPGWHEPGSMLEFTVNKQAYEALPKDLQLIVRTASRATNQDMLDEYTARNHMAMKQLIEEHNVKVLPLPQDVLSALKEATNAVIEKESADNADFEKIYLSYSEFYEGVKRYHELSEKAYYQNR